MSSLANALSGLEDLVQAGRIQNTTIASQNVLHRWNVASLTQRGAEASRMASLARSHLERCAQKAGASMEKSSVPEAICSVIALLDAAAVHITTNSREEAPTILGDRPFGPSLITLMETCMRHAMRALLNPSGHLAWDAVVLTLVDSLKLLLSALSSDAASRDAARSLAATLAKILTLDAADWACTVRQEELPASYRGRMPRTPLVCMLLYLAPCLRPVVDIRTGTNMFDDFDNCTSQGPPVPGSTPSLGGFGHALDPWVAAFTLRGIAFAARQELEKALLKHASDPNVDSLTLVQVFNRQITLWSRPDVTARPSVGTIFKMDAGKAHAPLSFVRFRLLLSSCDGWELLRMQADLVRGWNSLGRPLEDSVGGAPYLYFTLAPINAAIHLLDAHKQVLWSSEAPDSAEVQQAEDVLMEEMFLWLCCMLQSGLAEAVAAAIGTPSFVGYEDITYGALIPMLSLHDGLEAMCERYDSREVSKHEDVLQYRLSELAMAAGAWNAAEHTQSSSPSAYQQATARIRQALKSYISVAKATCQVVQAAMEAEDREAALTAAAASSNTGGAGPGSTTTSTNPDAAASTITKPAPAQAVPVSRNANQCWDELLAAIPVRYPGCWNPGCTNLSIDTEADLRLLRCSLCGVARYCSPECQKARWSSCHKAICPHIKVVRARAEVGERAPARPRRKTTTSNKERRTHRQAEMDALRGDTSASTHTSAQLPDGPERSGPAGMAPTSTSDASSGKAALSSSQIAAMSVGQLKELAREQKLDARGCVEKADLVGLITAQLNLC